MHALFPMNPLCMWRQFESSAGMVDSAPNDENYFKETLKVITECNTLSGYCWKNPDHEKCQMGFDLMKITSIIT